MKKFIFAFIALALVTCVVGFLLFLNGRLRSGLEQAQEESRKYQEEIARVQSERERSEKEKERLQQDAVAYLALNSKLQEENRKLLVSLEEARGLVQKKEKEIALQGGKLQEAAEKMKAGTSEDDRRSRAQLEEMRLKISELEALAGRERQLYYYNLGVAYSRAKLYDDAIESYERSISFGNPNPEAHYNLGLIYDKVKNEPLKALVHFEKYLELAPDSRDAAEVAGWIKRLSATGSG